MMTISGDLYPFTQENVDVSPEDQGVYALYDNDVTIYIGKASQNDTIRKRLQAHKRGDEGKCTQSATHYRREVTNYATTREQELLREYKQSYGKLPRCNEVMP
jgi:excinuclease UvrABC nuclease subunit